MRTLTAVAAVALVSFGFAGSAFAFKLSPSGAFTATGPASVSKSGVTGMCTATLTGSVNSKGGGKFTAATFTGSSTCNLVQATGLPWPFKATGAGAAVIKKVAASAGPLGTCGPSNVPVALNGGGVISFTNAALAGGCTVSGSLQTAPVVTVVP